MMLSVRRLALSGVRLLRFVRVTIRKPIIEIHGYRRKRTRRFIIHEIDDRVRRRRRRLGISFTVRRKRRLRRVADGVHIIQRRIWHGSSITRSNRD